MNHLKVEEQRQHLIEAAVAVKSKAYCPCSNFPVGCAVLSQDGSIFIGCNVENASYPCGSCAEAGAIAHAVSQGHRNLIAAAIATDTQEWVTPCGKCRQILSEFMPSNASVFMVNQKLEVKETQLGILLPLSFKLDMLPGQK
ncbi:Cytidine deaminase [Fasciolopsis buskii]|uniref:Cytidine deaminase n=1 Tax=Fasciolopsis buskii TaxID=27845 RepID=A0A8E0VJQ0_9TREM|nr:Cytidine deaminase [Fasciolopsis buski]